MLRPPHGGAGLELSSFVRPDDGPVLEVRDMLNTVSEVALYFWIIETLAAAVGNSADERSVLLGQVGPARPAYERVLAVDAADVMSGTATWNFSSGRPPPCLVVNGFSMQVALRDLRTVFAAGGFVGAFDTAYS